MCLQTQPPRLTGGEGQAYQTPFSDEETKAQEGKEDPQATAPKRCSRPAARARAPPTCQIQEALNAGQLIRPSAQPCETGSVNYTHLREEKTEAQRGGGGGTQANGKPNTQRTGGLCCLKKPSRKLFWKINNRPLISHLTESEFSQMDGGCFEWGNALPSGCFLVTRPA